MLFLKNYLTTAFRSRSGAGKFSRLKVALVSDALTRDSLEVECSVRNLTPSNYATVFSEWKPDLIFVESAWQGYRNSWKYGIASYAKHPDRTNTCLRDMLDMADLANIPAIFWNKEDGVHYSRFIDSARLFRYILTVDANCLDQYRIDVPGALLIDVMPFPVQSRFHHLDVIGKEKGFSSFVGSYGTHVHPNRRQWQDLLFGVFAKNGLDVYDRNSARKSVNYRYPRIPGLRVKPSVSYEKTAALYKSYKFNLNVNTVEMSPTMYSRRLIEIIAVGGVAISTPSLAAQKLFADYCHIVSSEDEMEAVLGWPPSRYGEAAERARQGGQIVRELHTWTNRLEMIEEKAIF